MKGPKHVLVLFYSLTGQTERVVQEITEALRQAGHNVDVERIVPVRDWVLPFEKAAFFSLWFRMLAGADIRQPIEWIPLSRKHYDCIVLGFQPWNLQPSIPVNAFLESPMARVFRGRPVVAVMTCRSRWKHAYVGARRKIARWGGTVVDALVIADRQGPAGSLVTTLYRLWENQTPPAGHWVAHLPPFGIGAHVLPVARQFGQELARRLLEDLPRDQYGYRFVNHPV